MPRKTDAPRTREYISHDPHTVALLRPDALVRLERVVVELMAAAAKRRNRRTTPENMKSYWNGQVNCGHTILRHIDSDLAGNGIRKQPPPDALARLEKWLKQKRQAGWLMPLCHKRWGKYTVTLQWGIWKAGHGYKTATGSGETLSLAIHAALDAAEAPAR